MLGAYPGSSFRPDFSETGGKMLQGFSVFIINVFYVFLAKIASHNNKLSIFNKFSGYICLEIEN